MIIVPTKTDVKSGSKTYHRPGNRLYYKLVMNKRRAFILAHENEHMKQAVVQYIYETIQNQSPPGRFLRRETDGSYSIKSKEETFQKIEEALNENKEQIEAYYRRLGQIPQKASRNIAHRSSFNTLKPVSFPKSPKIPTSADWFKLYNELDRINPEELVAEST